MSELGTNQNTVTFAHLADIHLGNDQYQSPVRFDDFARAFQDAVRRCLERRVDFVVIAGDLFHKRAVEPRALVQAVQLLRPLKDAGIPVIAVEGNHDRAVYGDEFSWVQFLAAEGLLTCLSPVVPRQAEPRWAEHVPGRGGSYVLLASGAVRVAGVPYLGAVAPDTLRRLANTIGDTGDGPFPGFSILVAHAGLEELMPGAPGALKVADFDPLAPHFDYVALGHIHKRLEHMGRFYNPGSLEACSSDEAETDHGLYFVTVDVDPSTPVGAGAPHHSVLWEPSRRRAFLRLHFMVGGSPTPAALMDALSGFLAREAATEDAAAPGAEPVVELTLEGQFAFEPRELNLRAVEAAAREALKPAVLRVRNHGVPPGMDPIETNKLSRDELEQDVLTTLFAAEDRFARNGHASEWAKAARDVKTLALAATSSEGLVAAVEGHAITLGLLKPAIPRPSGEDIAEQVRREFSTPDRYALSADGFVGGEKEVTISHAM